MTAASAGFAGARSVTRSAAIVGRKCAALPARLEGAARSGRCERVCALIADLRSGQEVLGEQQVRRGRTLADAEEIAHARGLLELLLQEPAQELLPNELLLLARQRRQGLDLLGDLPLLREGERDRRDGVVERRPRRVDPGNPYLLVGVEQVLDDHHSVVPLLDGLAVEVRGQLRHRLAVVVDGDRDVLLRRRELVCDLLVQGLGEARHPAGLYSTVNTAAPRILPSRRRVSASFASESGNGSTSVCTGISGASARNSSPSRRVRFDTDAVDRYAHRRSYGNDGISLMWMPAQTTRPPLATARSATGTSAPTGAKMIAASSSSGGSVSEPPAHSAPS